MKISEIIFGYNVDFGIYNIIEDVEFDWLALVNADLDFSFCTFIDNDKYLNNISENVKMIITTPEIAKLINNRGVCISDNPRISFFKLHNYLAQSKGYNIEREFKTQIGVDCNISKLSYISEENIRIGNNVTIEEFVSIKENTIIGDNSIIRAGSVVGGEGYEFKRMLNEDILHVKHIGWTVIGNYVEIQCNTCIVKAIYPWDKTIIEDNCKIDNLVHIAHGVKIRKGTFIVAGALIGGRTIINQNAWIGVGATVSNGLVIGKNAKVNIGAVATRNVDENTSVSGNFAVNHKRFIEFIKSIR